MHPRLLTSVILFDPVIQRLPPKMGFGADPPGPVNFALWRDDVWSNRAAAAAGYKKVFKKWDPRCLELMVQYGFRDLPTALHPDLPDNADAADPPVTLTTTKYHDVLGQIRERFHAGMTDGQAQLDRSTHADVDPSVAVLPVYRPEPPSTFHKLPSLRPSALFLLGEASYLNLKDLREGIKSCGQGVGGSGGKDKVKEVTLPKQGHFFAFEVVGETANHCASWLDEVVRGYRDTEREWKAKRQKMAKRDHLVLNEEWRRVIKSPSSFRAVKSRKAKL